MGKHPACGYDFPSVSNVKLALSQISENGFSFFSMPIAHPTLVRDVPKGVTDLNLITWTRTDLTLSCNDWNHMVVGKISDWLNVDSKNPNFAKRSEDVLLQELSFASHLGLPAVTIRLHRENNPNLSRILYERVCADSYYHNFLIWLLVPMISPKITASYHRSDVVMEDEEKEDPWYWWNNIRLMCNSEKKIAVALEMTADLPHEGILDRWIGEPVKMLIIPTTIFLTNKKGFPVLSRAHQAFIRRCISVNIRLMLTGANRHSTIKHYSQYIHHLYQTTDMSNDNSSLYKGFEDHLLIPLQPLMDNLEANTYEIFEKDPVKYTEYRRAIHNALLDRVSDEQGDTTVQVVMVVGAGRGPLVTASIAAANDAKRRVKIYAVEKNPNALITLADMKRNEWGDAVEVVHCDMRTWNPPEKCDILVSELLGSFGDNELSPECLDGAQKFLKDDGISIPSAYTSYLCPLMSMKLHNEARCSSTLDKPAISKFEMPYVVHQVSRYFISPIQPLFTFVHPNKDPVIDNRRYKKLNFIVKEDSLLHGFAGFFDTVLYKDIKLSIHPDTFSEGMFSWFPVYFPIKEPIFIRKGDDLVVHFWRRHDLKSVWYEWAVTKPTVIPIHNPNGRSYNIGLF